MWGMIPLRVIFGVVIILQGLERFLLVRHHDMSIIGQLPNEWAYVVLLVFSVIEIIAGAMAIPGLFTRIVGFVIAAEMFLAIFFERIPFAFGSDLQTQLLLLGIASLMIFSGSGRYSVDHLLAKRHLLKYPSKKWELYCLAETPYTKWWE